MDEEIIADDYVEKGWIKAWFVFDTQGINSKIVKELLDKMLVQFNSEKDVKIVSSYMSESNEVEANEEFVKKGIKKVFSQLLEVEFVARDFEVLVRLVMTYGPSALEVLEPDEIMVDSRTAQNSLVSIADMMHKFALLTQGGVKIKKS
jgi:hypothetical protein